MTSVQGVSAMSRYIDADALIADLEEWKQNPNNDDSSMDLVNHFQGIVRTEPHIDIVRCKECKWYDGTAYSNVRCRCLDRAGNMKGLIECTDDDFCSYGERSE